VPDVRRYNPSVSADLVAILRRMLAKKPADRYQTPADLLADLAREPRPARPTTEDRPLPALPPPSPPPSRETSTIPLTYVHESTRKPTPQLSSAGKPVAATPPSEAARIGASQCEWAQQQVARGNYDYGVKVLLACCRRDPGNLDYHQALRQARQSKPESAGKGFLSRLRGLAARLRLRLARKAGRYADVLAGGEQVLERAPDDLATQVAMSDAAAHLGLKELALWLLEQAREQDQASALVNRALARFYEERDDYRQAAAYWERVARVAPHDGEAARKVKDLAALDTMQRTRNKQKRSKQTGRGSGPAWQD
jgi:tetratricopeptide (TPR) repeat protein